MAVKEYLDKGGLSYFFSKLKVYIKGMLGVKQAHWTTTTEIADNSEITIPLKYEVGNDSLSVYCMGEKLVKADPANSLDGHYIEVGTTGGVSTKIQLYNIGQSVPVGITFEVVVHGIYK